MISWTRLLTGETQDNDNLRYSNHLNCIPRIVVWNITRNCNLFCRHCYFEAKKIKDSYRLSQREAKDFMGDLAKLKVGVLLFSGGEPLLRKDIFSLAKFAKAQGLNLVLSTNGTLISKDIAKKIKEAGFSYVGISVDGKEKTNDGFRKKPGAFVQSLTGLKNCQKIGLKVGLRLTLTKYNFKDLPYIFTLVEKEGIDRLCIYHLVYTGRAIKEMDLGHQEKREALELIWQKTQEFLQKGLNSEILTVDNHADGVWIYLKLKKTNPPAAQRAWELLKLQGGNSSGIRIGAVDNLGNIYADQFLRSYPLGNIRLKKFSQTWLDPENSLLQVLRNRIPYLPERCQRCSFIKICNGNFRARAEAVSGNLWQDDPACYLTEEERHQGGCLGNVQKARCAQSTLCPPGEFYARKGL